MDVPHPLSLTLQVMPTLFVKEQAFYFQSIKIRAWINPLFSSLCCEFLDSLEPCSPQKGAPAPVLLALWAAPPLSGAEAVAANACRSLLLSRKVRLARVTLRLRRFSPLLFRYSCQIAWPCTATRLPLWSRSTQCSAALPHTSTS